MQKSVWTSLLMAVITLGLIASLLAVAYGVFAVGYDLVVEYEEWDGMGIVIGIFILAVALPVMLICVVSRRALKQRL